MSNDGRYEKSVRLRLNLNDSVELGMFDWLQSLKPPRRMKTALKLGVELAHAAMTNDFQRLAELLPGFVAHIEARAVAAVQSPANRDFEVMVNAQVATTPPPPAAPPALDEEPIMLTEPDFAGLEY